MGIDDSKRTGDEKGFSSNLLIFQEKGVILPEEGEKLMKSYRKLYDSLENPELLKRRYISPFNAKD